MALESCKKKKRNVALRVFKTQTRLMDPTQSEHQTGPTEPRRHMETHELQDRRVQLPFLPFSQMESAQRAHGDNFCQHLPSALTRQLQYAPQRCSLRNTSLPSTLLQRDTPREDMR